MEKSPLFSSVERKKKKVAPAFIGIILASVVLIAGFILIVIMIQKTGPKYMEGHTVYHEVVRQGDEGFTDHINFLKIINAVGQVSENYLGGQQAVVAGEITNSSSAQTVDVVEIKVTLYSPESTPIKEFIKTPIKPDFPLKPREIRRFSVWIEPLPSEWLSGVVDVKIQGYRIKK